MFPAWTYIGSCTCCGTETSAADQTRKPTNYATRTTTTSTTSTSPLPTPPPLPATQQKYTDDVRGDVVVDEVPVGVSPEAVLDGEVLDGAAGSEPGVEVQSGRGHVDLLQKHALRGHDGHCSIK